MNFKSKKIAVLGLGIEGLSLVQYLSSKDALITVFDQKPELELGENFKTAKRLNAKFSLSKTYLAKGLLGFDYIFRSPGVKLSLPQLKKAQKEGIPISSATKLFFKECPGKVIGVTGTKGKGTTSTLIYQALKKSGQRVFLVGNIGQPALNVLKKLDKDSWVVYELSSFQLQDLRQSPAIAVVLFITSEHLDYHASVQEYIEAKAAIVKFQTPTNQAVLNADNKISSSFARQTKGKAYYFSRLKKTKGAYIRHKKEIILSTGKKEACLGSVKNLKLLGEHNWENVTAAAAAASLAGASPAAIKKAIFSFSGLEHRLEFVAKAGGVSFYNDSFSTTPETAIAAIRAFKKPLTLIAGGSEKGSDFTKLGKEISQSSVKNLILIGQMTSRIKKAVQNAGFKGKIITGLTQMAKIVKASLEAAQSGEIVLLSPACASFDMFVSYKARGQSFKKEVLKRA
jgi:UDP-N-acetylmuramoylalanine--D-glutamate ligase